MSTQQSLPKYLQISELLIRDIAAGRLENGSRLPTERDLAAQLSTSIGTLRKALAELEQQGLLERVQGSGNYIRSKSEVNSIYSFFRVELLEGGGLPRAEVLDVSKRAKPAEFPYFGSNSDGFRIRRMRYLNDIPAVLEEIWLDANHAAQISADDLNEALYVYYRKSLDLWITRVEDRIGLRPKPMWCPENLNLNETSVCVDRLSFDQREQSVEFSISWINSNVAQYVARIK
jgi:GntR family transcriptional regulator